MSNQVKEKKSYIEYYIFALILLFTYTTRFYDYLLFHTLAELFSIVIGVSIFIIFWNSKNYIDNSFFLIIGISFVFIGFIDLIHSLAYTGMNIFTGYDTNLPTQLWIAARYLQSISFLVASLIEKKKVNAKNFLVGFSLYTVLVIALIFLRLYPDCFIEGYGLTDFKIISEYIINIILGITIYVMFRNRFLFEKKIFNILIFSIILTMASELAFTFYIDAFDLSNLIGHLIKIVAFYLLYKAIINIGLENPIELLFRRLKQSEKQLRLKTKDLEQVNVFLQDAELRYRTTFEQSPDGIMIIDPERLKAIEFNDVICDLLGYSRIEFATMKISDYDVIENEKVTKSHIQRVFRYGRDDFETKFRTKLGEIKDIYVSAKIIKLGGGKYIQSICRDITESKKIQLQIEEERKKYADLIKNIPNVIYSTLPDETGTTIFISDRWKEWTGISPEEQYKDEDAWLKTLHPDDRGETQKRFNEAIAQKKAYDLEYRVIHRDTDHIFYLRDQGVPIINNTGEIIKYDGIISNITERKKAEEKLEQFVSTVSHELKNPIAVLLMSLNYVTTHREEITKEQEIKLRDGIMRNVNLLNKLVNDLLTLSRIEEKKMVLDWKKYSPIKIINDNLSLLEPNFKSKNISIQLDVNKDIVLYGDIARIDQIFRILIDNAWKYSKVGSNIIIKAIDHYSGKYNSKGIDGTLFHFIDSGIGIHPKDLPFIFDRFFRSSTVNHIPGTGLGLTIAKELIELHQGKIFVESEYGKGTTFLVFLPKVQNK
ncbi:MAG: sensor histidine kinase [Promethearchaeota archaeon]|jgi:PAS domain S-box-containing protein